MTDTDICLAMARAMGLKGVHQMGIVSPEHKDAHLVILHAAGPDDARFDMPWDPIHSGADFDAVLMWAILDKTLCVYVSDEVAEIRSPGEAPHTVEISEDMNTHPHIRRAVCTAIVEALDATQR